VADASVFLAPNYSPQIARLESTGDFRDAASWSFFAPSLIDEAAVSFAGAVYDGRRVWFVPNKQTTVAGCEPARPFRGTEAWAFLHVPPSPVLEAGTSDAGYTFSGGAFDGRFVYLAPADGRVVRFELSDPADAASARWSSFDTNSLTDAGKGYQRAVFDGRYVTFLGASSVLVRFDARTPAAQPPFAGTSFF
jgi:hypothetical protein